MFKKTLLLVAPVLMTALLPLSAQTFQGQVAQDPRSNTVTYTLDISGPPRGFATVFLGTSLLPFPIQLGPIGPLYLDPAALVPLVQLPLDSQGKGQFGVVLPMGMTAGLPLHFQTLFQDTFNTLRVPNKWVTLYQDLDRKDNPGAGGYGLGYDSEGSDMDIQGFGDPGTKLNFQFFDRNGRLVASQLLTVGLNGQTPRVRIQIPGSFGKGSRWQVWRQPPGSSQPVLWKSGRMN